ncbi:protein RICE SALT SENSITIVE 3-like [Quercus lobata]|uniref:protein RICE SALT SENSITIVE 3-like n=1 Tax=Quercus lobata TaxID=97700 RepID=UPI0012461D27|nr:protein RICE SALT SENSITIVE 3-like [Quercus lobata]XP_030940706.1 protein RICE SALT SENSITIVE 3-like [Quercus lobata]
MEEYLAPIPITHLLQHTLRSLCIQENSQWVYAVFWRILPRNYPPPNWGFQGVAKNRSRINKRNWMLAWEDSFCNFVEPIADFDSGTASYVHKNFDPQLGLQPELFFKMSHEIYNFGEGLIGQVAADNSTHRWFHKEFSVQEHNSSAWKSIGDWPRTWKAQFQSGIKTISLIAVKEGVLQLGAVNKVAEDPSYVAQVQNIFSYFHGVPGFLLPHPASSSPTTPFKLHEFNHWSPHYTSPSHTVHSSLSTMEHLYNINFNQQLMITPSMSSLEALLSKLPSVVPTPSPPLLHDLHDYSPLEFSIPSQTTGAGWSWKEVDRQKGMNEEKEHVWD